MTLNYKKINMFLLAVQGAGAIFVSIFLVAYLAGLPSTAVLHSEPAFRIPLSVFGVVLLVLVFSAVATAVLSKKD